jgi:hypothetical protein
MVNITHLLSMVSRQKLARPCAARLALCSGSAGLPKKETRKAIATDALRSRRRARRPKKASARARLTAEGF